MEAGAASCGTARPGTLSMQVGREQREEAAAQREEGKERQHERRGKYNARIDRPEEAADQPGLRCGGERVLGRLHPVNSAGGHSIAHAYRGGERRPVRTHAGGEPGRRVQRRDGSDEGEQVHAHFGGSARKGGVRKG